jgi:hypothetical protein
VQSANVSQLVMIPGIITAASKPKHMANTVTVMCRDCRLETTFAASAAGLVLPRTCSLSNGPNGEARGTCSMDPWVVLPNKSTFADQQSLKIQVRFRRAPCHAGGSAARGQAKRSPARFPNSCGAKVTGHPHQQTGSIICTAKGPSVNRRLHNCILDGQNVLGMCVTLNATTTAGAPGECADWRAAEEPVSHV